MGCALDADEILPGLYQGSGPPPGDAVQRCGFDLLVLAAEEYQPAMFFGVGVIRMSLQDANLTIGEWLDANLVAADVAKAVRAGKKVLVTCYAGINRSGLVTALAVHALTGWSGDQIVKHIRQCRDGALSNEAFVKAIRRLVRQQQPVMR